MNDIITKETILNKHSKEHQVFVECMDSALYEIWEYSKLGNTEAQAFMQSKLHDKLVQFELDFQNTDIPELNARATYGAYEAIMTETMSVLNRLNNEYNVSNMNGTSDKLFCSRNQVSIFSTFNVLT